MSSAHRKVFYFFRPWHTAIVVLLMLCTLLSSCHSRKHHAIIRGFYYWKTTFSLSSYEQNRLVQAGCNYLYLRCFDVDWNIGTQRPEPVGILRFQQLPDANFHFVPVVFITQSAITHVGNEQLPALAANISKLMNQLFSARTISSEEVQIDCDWTANNRTAYFNLLILLKQQPFFQHKKLSCTVRLHQVKYQMISGIPPVDRALIMCYNVGNLKQPGGHNSILDADLVKDYLSRLSAYPLPVDVALPLFRWCLHFRSGKFQGILRDVAPEEVQHTALFSYKKGSLYTCVADTVWHHYHLQSGDELRLESPSLQDIQDVASFTANAVRNDTVHVLLFHTDSLTLSKYSTNDLETIYHSFD